MIFFFLLFLIPISWSQVTLEEAYKTAEKHLESMQRADSQMNQAELRKKIAIGAMTPTVLGFGTYTEIDPISGGSSNAFTRSNQYSAGLRLIQPLLRGGIVSAYNLRNEEVLLSLLNKETNQVAVYQLTISAFYNLYLAKRDMVSLVELEELSQKRVKELKSRAQLGRSRQGDLVQAQAQLLNVEASIQGAQSSLEAAKLQFEFITGMKDVELVVETTLPPLGSVGVYLSKVQERPDVKAQNQRIVVAEKQVGVIKGGHNPNLDVTGNYYFTRTGVLEPSKWDVGLQLTVPILQGNVVTNSVKDAVETKTQAQLTGSELVRAAERDIQTLYQQYHQNLLQVQRLEEAVKKSKESYDLSLKDYKYGQLANLEVLLSLNVYIDSRRAFDRAYAMAYASYKNLEASSGVLP